MNGTLSGGKDTTGPPGRACRIRSCSTSSPAMSRTRLSVSSTSD